MSSQPSLINLRVGQQLFLCRREVLTGIQAGFFGAMMSGGWAEDRAGEVHIDRDPTHFQFILAYLRDGATPLPDTSLARRQLHAEAAYYSLEGLVEELDAAEARHAALEAAREQKLLAQALVFGEQASMVREASAALAEASAAASTAQSDVQRLEGELAAAHDAAAAAHGQLQAAVAQEARQTAQAAWHAAALRWHSLRDQHTAARNALGKAQGKERHARVSKLAALRLDAPPAEPSPITTSVIPLPPRPPMPHRRPPADLAAFARQQAELGAVDPDLQWGRMRWLEEMHAEREPRARAALMARGPGIVEPDEPVHARFVEGPRAAPAPAPPARMPAEHEPAPLWGRPPAPAWGRFHELLLREPGAARAAEVAAAPAPAPPLPGLGLQAQQAQAALLQDLLARVVQRPFAPGPAPPPPPHIYGRQAQQAEAQAADMAGLRDRFDPPQWNHPPRAPRQVERFDEEFGDPPPLAEPSPPRLR